MEKFVKRVVRMVVVQASLDALNGLFTYYSYRDPQPLESLNIYDKAVNVNAYNIKEGVISDEDLEQAKLTIFQKLEAPKSVRDDGMSYFNYDIDDETKQERRGALLDCSLEDVLEVCEKYFPESAVRSKVVIGHDAEGIQGNPNWTTEVLK